MRMLENPSFTYADRRARGGRDDGNERGSDGIANIHVEKKSEQRHQNDSAAEAGERSKKSRDEGDGRDDGGELEDSHSNFF